MTGVQDVLSVPYRDLADGVSARFRKHSRHAAEGGLAQPPKSSTEDGGSKLDRKDATVVAKIDRTPKLCPDEDSGAVPTPKSDPDSKAAFRDEK